MRVFLVLIPFLLVGCAKEPTYLQCTSTVKDLENRTYYIVLDHANDLWMEAEVTSNFYVPDFNSVNSGKYYIDVQKLIETEDKYYRATANGAFVNRKTLTFNIYWDCKVLSDLSDMRSIGLEKNRNKI